MQEADMVKELLTYFTADNALFIFIAYLGMLGHAYKKFATGDLEGSVIDYVFRNNWKRTVLAVGSTFIACAAAILGEQIPAQLGAFIALAWSTGYMFDSALNKESA